MIDEKINTSSRASAARPSLAATLPFIRPTSIKRRNRRLSFASFRQIFARTRKSFLLKASSASIQFAATEPDARTNCRTSSVLLIVLSNSFTKARTACANRNVLSSRSRGLALSILDLGFEPLLEIWSLGLGASASGGDCFLRRVREIVCRDQREAAFLQQLLPFFDIRSFEANDQRHG